MGKILKNYVYNFSYQILVILVPLITAPYLSRTVGAEGLGIYSYVNSSAYAIAMIAMLGIYNYGNREIAYVRDDSEKLNKVFWELMSLRLFLGAFGTIIYGFVTFINYKYAMYFVIYYGWTLAYFLDCTWLYVGVEDMKPAVLKNVFAKVAGVAGIFLLVKGPQDLAIYIGILSTSTLIANLSAYPYLSKYVGKPKIEFSSFKRHIRGSILLFLPSAATLVYLQLDKVLVVLLTGDSAQLGFYDYAEKIVTIPLTLITVLSTVMMPRIAHEHAVGNRDNMFKYLKAAADCSLLLAFPLAFGLSIASTNLVNWYLGDTFALTAVAIIVLAPIVVLNSLEGILGRQYLTATNMLRPLTVAYVSAAVINVLINCALLPILGCIGAAVATVASSLTSVVVEIIAVNDSLPIKKLLSSVPRYFLFGVAVAVTVVIFTLFSPVRGVLLTVAQMSVGLVSLFAMCVLTKDEVFYLIIRRLTSAIIG